MQKESENIIDEETKLYFWATDNKRYSVATWEQFIGLSNEDLTLLGKHAGKFAGLLMSGQPQSEIISQIRAKVKEDVLLNKPIQQQ